MVKDFQENAYAKVNLHLEVSGKRENGYHDIVSIMASVDLFDVLELTEIVITAGEVSVDILSAGGRNSAVLDSISPEKNLITKAARAYFAGSGKGAKLTVRLEKNIPAGAGMGGGSSDAAAMLRLLNRTFALYSPEELVLLGGRIGADVPFCVRGGVSVCEGIGEILTPASLECSPHVLVLNDGIHVDTASAYSMVDKRHEVFGKTADCISADQLQGFLSGPLENFREHFYNDFEPPVFSQYPVLAEIKQQLYSEGSIFSVMTGSGSTLVALFKNREDADRVQCLFDGKVKFAYVTTVRKNQIY